jgi:Uma2 family endonuclease
MALAISEKYLPATLTVGPMSDEEFAKFCAKYPDNFVEMNAEGEIIIKPPNYSLTAVQNGEIYGQLREWARADGRGVVMDSSGGYVLPNGARRSPDASWIPKDRLETMDRARYKKFWQMCPPFLIELRSQWDRLPKLREKMREWVDNGAELGWLIDPERRAVEIYRPGQTSEVLENLDVITAGAPVAGFTLQLARVWDPLA